MKPPSIRSKLTLTFIFISLIGIITIALLSYLTTTEEVRNYFIEEARQEYIDRLISSYAENGSWENIDPYSMDNPDPNPNPEQFESLSQSESVLVLDMNGDVAFPPFNRWGEAITLTPEELEAATEIFYEGEQIGTLVTFNSSLIDNIQDPYFLSRITQFTLIGSVIAIVIALVLGVFASDWISRPIRKLTEATNSARQGDLSVRVDVDSQDELGKLAVSFNEMNTELERLIKARRQLTADVAHELRTPISIILSYSEGVQDGVIPPDEKTFQIVHDEANRLDRLIEDLNTLSQAESGELAMYMDSVDVCSILKDLHLEKIQNVQQKNLEIHLDVQENCPKVVVDTDRILQVIRNLITNAARYSEPEGVIMVSVKPTKDRFLQISVSDDGPGVPEDALKMIFQRCFRLDASRQRDTEGSGLGLPIARSIVERHNGEIWAENEPEGGLKISFIIPINP